LLQTHLNADIYENYLITRLVTDDALNSLQITHSTIPRSDEC